MDFLIAVPSGRVHSDVALNVVVTRVRIPHLFESASPLIRNSNTTDALNLCTIESCSADVVWGVSDVAWTTCPVVGSVGCGVSSTAPSRRLCRALSNSNIVESYGVRTISVRGAL